MHRLTAEQSAHDFSLLWSQVEQHDTPQSVPVLVPERDRLYHHLNSVGVGVTSLYHTLIDPLLQPAAQFPGSSCISNRILNLPVHQDLASSDMERVADEFLSALDRA